MSNLFWLTEAQMARLRPYFPQAMVARASMTCGCSAALSSSAATACDGAVRRGNMDRRRPSAIAGSAGAIKVSSPASWSALPPRVLIRRRS